MSAETFSVALAPRRPGCAGRDGECRGEPRYLADLAYCECGEAPWSEHADLDPDLHGADVETDLALCAECALLVRHFHALQSMRSIRPAT